MKVLMQAETIEKNKIQLIKAQGASNGRNILIIGVFHGEEPQGKYLIDKYLETDLS